MSSEMLERQRWQELPDGYEPGMECPHCTAILDLETQWLCDCKATEHVELRCEFCLRKWFKDSGQCVCNDDSGDDD